MNRMTLMRRICCVALALLMLFPAAAFAEKGKDTAEIPARFVNCGTVNSLFKAAEAALKEGIDPSQVYDEMYSAAEAKKMLREFSYALENAAGWELKQFEKAVAVVEKEGRRQDFGKSVFQSYWDKIGFDPYGHYNGSDAFREMIADPAAQYCLEPAVWTESDFQKAYGTRFSEFRSARPRAGYVCLVIADKSQIGPETAWNAENNGSSFMYQMRNVVQDMIRLIEEPGMNPIFTGNPNLASSFWVFEIDFPFYAWYGHNNKKEVRGFNCNASMTVIDAVNHKVTAKCVGKNRLPRRISTWHNWIAQADIPYLADSSDFRSLVRKTEKAIEKQYETEDLSPRMIAINVQAAVNRLLKDESEKSTDAWVHAICEKGARDVVLGKGSVSFSLRSYDPRVKELGTYSKAADRSGWLQSALANASAYDLKLTLPVEDGRLTQQGRKSLTTTLKKAAATAQKDFGGKDMASALADRFFPAPFEGKITEATELLSPSDAFREWYASRGLADTGLSAEELAIICYAQKSQTINAKAGPHQVGLDCTGAEPAAIIADCAKAVLDGMAYSPAKSRVPADQAESLLREKLAEAAIKAHTKAKSKYAFTIDLDELADGQNPKGYLDLLAEFDTGKTVEYIRTTAANFPETEAEPLPKAGKMTAWIPDTSGTKVTFDLYDGAGPTYLVVRSADKNNRIVSAFILPGKKVTLQIPEGNYRFACCSGQWWYGEKELFSTNGSYWISESTQILGKPYTHTFSLNPADEYELLFEKASPNDFR